MAFKLETTPLSGTLGAEVDGVDLRRPLETGVVNGIRKALLTHRVLFFRDQLLSPEELVAFAKHFGELTPAHPIIAGLAAHPELFVVDSALLPERVKRRDRSAGENKWHTDVTFVERPPLGSLLNAHIIPQRGGDTQWADLVDAYNTLSPPLQQLLDGLDAAHDARRAFGYVAREDPGGGAHNRLEDLKPVRHPVVRVHPETGERALFVNPTFTSHLVGLSHRESSSLLRLLYDHIAQPERTVRWRWRVGDLAFWDNRATAHYAVSDYGEQHRRMHRVTLAGDVPVGPRVVTGRRLGAGTLHA